MTDLNKPRLTENNKYTGEADCATPCCDIHNDCACGKNAEKGGCFYELVKRLNELENAIESGELAEVVHGHWRYVGGETFECSQCWARFCTDEGGIEDAKYCFGCGAKMDLENKK